MLLPGGLWRNGKRVREFALCDLTGEVELALAEAERSDAGLPARITAVLASALRHVGGKPVTPDVVRALTVADRQFLARSLAAHLGADSVWLTATCRSCGHDFDFRVLQSVLPVKEAGRGAPYVEVSTSLGKLKLRVPNGEDQEAIAAVPEAMAVRALVSRCLVKTDDVRQTRVSGNESTDEAMTGEDLDRIEGALESVAPEVTLWAQTSCPECGEPNTVWVDPYLSLRGLGRGLFNEIHCLARHYHWSEAEILQLPRRRRRVYLDLLDEERGMRQ
jgi:hypothetical protein